MHTPWGESDHQRSHGNGVTFYGTPSHGGFFVRPDIRATMPEYLRLESGWYEEDCEWCLVAIAFPERFSANEYKNALDTFINWHPDLYERHFKVTIAPGESYMKDERAFYENHANDLIAISAIGRQDDFILVTACLGGLTWWMPRTKNPERTFLVPRGDYTTRHFVVDPNKYPEVDVSS